MKIKVHKETLYLISLVLSAFGIAMSVAANLGTSVYIVPAIALASKISAALPTYWNPVVLDIIGSQPFAELIVHTIFLIVFCIIIRRFRPFFLLAFLATFIYTCILYGFQWIPAFWPEIDHNYPLYVRIILLCAAITSVSLSITLSLKAYLYPPIITFVQKGLIEHFNIKRAGLFLLLNDLGFMILSIFIIYGVQHDWQFWNYNLSYGSLINVLLLGPLVGVFSKVFNKFFEVKTLLPNWEKAFEIENKKGY